MASARRCILERMAPVLSSLNSWCRLCLRQAQHSSDPAVDGQLVRCAFHWTPGMSFVKREGEMPGFNASIHLLQSSLESAACVCLRPPNSGCFACLRPKICAKATCCKSKVSSENRRFQLAQRLAWKQRGAHFGGSPIWRCRSCGFKKQTRRGTCTHCAASEASML